MDFLSIKEISSKWGISTRRVQVLCNEKRIEGATKVGHTWIIPATAQKPHPANKKNAKHADTQYYTEQVRIRREIKKKMPLAVAWLKSRGIMHGYREIVLAALSIRMLQKLNYKTDANYVVFKWFGLTTSPFFFELVTELIPIVDPETDSPANLTNTISWAYQYLNGCLSDNQYQNTQFFTEEYMVKFLTDAMGPSLSGKVSDICCGGGNFLSYALIKKICTYKHLSKEKIFAASEELFGYDLDSQIARVAYVNIVLTALSYAFINGIKIDVADFERIKPAIFFSATPSVRGSLDLETKISKLGASSDFKDETLLSALGNADYLLTNPPFATVKGMTLSLKKYLKKSFEKANCDLCAAFLERSFDYLSTNGQLGIVVQNAWMFLDSFAKLREYLIHSYSFEQIVDLGSAAFIDLNGEKSSVALVVASHKMGTVKKIKYTNYSNQSLNEKTSGINCLLEENNENTSIMDPCIIMNNENYRFDFHNVGQFKNFYYQNERYKAFAIPMQGTSTGNSRELVDFFWNRFNDVEWRLVSKGGGYSRWRGLNRYVLKWGDDGNYIKMQKGSALRNAGHFDHTELVFSDTGTTGLNVRILLPKQIFIASGPGIRIHSGEKYAHLSYLNSRIASYYIQMLTPKLTIAAGYISKLPINDEIAGSPYLSNLGKTCCDLKEHLLIYRPNNIEYSSNGFVEQQASVKENATILLMDDIFTYLQLMESEKKIDDYLLNLWKLNRDEQIILNSEMGPPPMYFEKHSNLPVIILDRTMSSLIDKTCLLKKSKINNTRYGADNILEYISREYILNPYSIYENIQAHIKDFVKTQRKYVDLMGCPQSLYQVQS
jgi:hypothetical protein